MDSIINPGIYYSGNVKFMEKLSEIDPKLYWISTGNKRIESIEEIGSNEFFQINFRLLGGKGGFGSLLKSFRIHKSSNQLMARDLTGRRLADVREEERLRRWIARKAERDAKKKKEEEEKLLKLKSGSKVKHHFKDKKYMRQRDVLLEKVDDAFEAGLKELEDQPSSSSTSKDTTATKTAAEDSDSDIDLDCEVPLPKHKKRKFVNVGENTIPDKKIKIDSTAVEVSQSAVAPESNNTVVLAHKECKKIIKNDIVKSTNASVTKEYAPIDLEKYDDAISLEEFGLDHLKHELERRGLKCGGSLKERTERLFSVKGLTVDQYPKKLRAVKK